MNDAYETWKRERAAVDPDPAFVEGVMERVRAEASAVGPAGRLEALLGFLARPPVAAAALALFLGAGLARWALMLLFVLITPGEGV